MPLTIAYGISQGAASKEFGLSPSSQALGAAFGPVTKGPTDIYGLLPNSYGGYLYNTIPQPPTPWVGGTNYYVNGCQTLTITGVSTASPAVYTYTAAGSPLAIGDTVVVSGVSSAGGLIVGSNGTFVVGALSGSTATLTGSSNPLTYSSGGTMYAVRNGMAPGLDTNSGLTPSLPLATIDKLINTTGATAGDWNGLVNTGTYNENTAAGGCLTINRSFTNWANITTYTGKQDVIVQNASGQAGVVRVRGTSAAYIQFQNITFQPNPAGSITHTIWVNPTSDAVTTNHLRFINCPMNGGIFTSATNLIQIGADLTNIGNVISGTPTVSGADLVVTCSTTAPLAAGDQVTIGSVTGFTALNGIWTVRSVSANTSITLANAGYLTPGLIGGTTTLKYSGTDATVNDFVISGCPLGNGFAFSSGTVSPMFIAIMTRSSTAQPFTNIGIFNNRVIAGASYSDWSTNGMHGINNIAVVGNYFPVNVSHAFILGEDQAGVNLSGYYNNAPVTNGYIGGNNFDASAGATGHGALVGNNCSGIVFENNIVIGGLHGIVIKGAINSSARGNLVKMTAVGALHGIYAKASYQVTYADNIVYTNQAGSWAYYSYNDSGASNVLDGPTNLVSNTLIPDNATAGAVFWPPTAQSSGGAFTDYNIYDIRAWSAATWLATYNTQRAVSTAATFPNWQAGWATNALPALSMAITGISGGNTTPIVLTVASTTGLTVGNTVVITGTTRANGTYVIGQTTATTVTLTNSILGATASGTGTLQYQFADNLANDAHSQYTTPGTTGNRNDVVYVGGTANINLTYYCNYIYQDGRIMSNIGLEPVNPNTPFRYARWLFETAYNSSGTYVRANPFNLPTGNYSVVIRQMVGSLPSNADPVVSQVALSYAS